MIEIENLQKSFGTNKVLHDINITINDGEIYGLIGVSGAGKSTLLRCINGLETYDAGSLKIDGTEINQLTPKAIRSFRREIGMIFQQFHLMERMNVYQNIAFPMKCWKKSKKEINEKVSSLLKLVELEDKKNSRPCELSGGQKQRVAIARALAMDPKILLCDEATSALDPNTTGSILELLKKINKDLGLTIIVVTHQMDVVKQICNRVSVLSNGILTCTNNVKDLFLKQPDMLTELYSEDLKIPVPKENINIEILFQAEQNSYLLSDLSLKTKVPYRMVWSKLDNYDIGAYGSYILNILPSDFTKVENYLNKSEIEWRVL